jgi:hypothetical protein
MDKVSEWFRFFLGHRSVPECPSPLAGSSTVGLGSANDHRGEWVQLPGWLEVILAQNASRLVSCAAKPAPFFHQVEDSIQVKINRIPISGAAVLGKGPANRFQFRARHRVIEPGGCWCRLGFGFQHPAALSVQAAAKTGRMERQTVLGSGPFDLHSKVSVLLSLWAHRFDP